MPSGIYQPAEQECFPCRQEDAVVAHDVAIAQASLDRFPVLDAGIIQKLIHFTEEEGKVWASTCHEVHEAADSFPVRKTLLVGCEIALCDWL